MKKIYFALMCIASLMIMAACGPKTKEEHVIAEFEKLIEEVEDKKGKLTVEEWKEMNVAFDKRFKELGIDDIDMEKFSAMQKLKLVGLTVRWSAAMAESSGTLMEGIVDEAQKQAEEKKTDEAAGEAQEE